jgi:hypothetical protein
VNSKILKDFIRSNGYAWPGGYPCALLMADGEVIDAQSARENYKQILGTMRHPESTSQEWMPVQAFIHWEGDPIICAHSGREIPSAYGQVECD